MDENDGTGSYPTHYILKHLHGYFPYGKTLREWYATNEDTERFQTTHHQRDTETTLDYRGARFYDADVGSFLSLDPLAKKYPNWIDIGQHPKYPSIDVYTQTLNSAHFKRNLKVVLLYNTKKDKYVLLASTDLYLSALNIVQYYGLRFQIEFLFRDAKQFTGLTHCQARDYDKLDFHFNMSMSALNVYQLQIKMNEQKNKSINAFIRKAYNERFSQMLLTELNQKTKLREFLDIKSPYDFARKSFGGLRGSTANTKGRKTDENIR